MTTRRGSFELTDIGIREILLIIGVICFLLAAFDVLTISRVNLADLGLAFFAAAFLFAR